MTVSSPSSRWRGRSSLGDPYEVPPTSVAALAALALALGATYWLMRDDRAGGRVVAPPPRAGGPHLSQKLAAAPAGTVCRPRDTPGGPRRPILPHIPRRRLARLLLVCYMDRMTATAPAPPLILIAVSPEHSLASLLEGRPYTVVQVHSGALALRWVHVDVRPDVIILGADLPDMSGIEACTLLHSDLRIGHTVPTLILAPTMPTPEQRVAAVRAGVWDFIPYPPDPDELSLSLQTYLHAKQNIDVALAAGLVDPATGLHTRHALARRARELGALMSRARGGLACVVFALDADPADPKPGSLVARSTRVSDVAGRLSPTEFAVLAPATDDAGAVKLAQRIGGALREVVGASGPVAPASALQVGYDAVANLKYSPIDPVALLLRATTAVRNGTPEPGCPWMRRFDETKASYKGASV